MSTDPDMIVAGASVRLPGHTEVVRLTSVISGPFWKLYFERTDGTTDKETLSEEELADLEVVEVQAVLPLDGDPHEFRLAIEAHRIKVSFAHDMAALAVSNI